MSSRDGSSAPLRRWARLLLLVSFCAASHAGAQTPTGTVLPMAAPAAGGVRLIEALEASRLAVVGRVGSIRQLDAHGYGAGIWIESALGDPSLKLEPGTPVTMAWEELAQARPVRFDDQDRILVCLERLPTASLWRKRFPDPAVRRQTLAIAMNGEAFLRNPSPGTVDLLHHYLSLPPADRESEAGVAFLLSLAEGAELPVALSAVQRMQGISLLSQKLGQRGPAPLAAAVLRQDLNARSSEALLALIETHRPEGLGELLQQAIAAGKKRSMPSPDVYRALGAAHGSIPEKTFAQLLKADDASYREVAARYATGDRASAQLRKLFEADSDAGVRAAALDRLVEIEQGEALDTALGALTDPDPRVRRAAARAAAHQGEAGAEGLRAVVFGTFEPIGESELAARSAVAGLTMAGPRGRKTLIEIARTHPDKSLRRLALMGLGRGSSHEEH